MPFLPRRTITNLESARYRRVVVRDSVNDQAPMLQWTESMPSSYSIELLAFNSDSHHYTCPLNTIYSATESLCAHDIPHWGYGARGCIHKRAGGPRRRLTCALWAIVLKLAHTKLKDIEGRDCNLFR